MVVPEKDLSDIVQRTNLKAISGVVAMTMQRKLKYAVLGSASVPDDSPEIAKAYAVGRAIAGFGAVLLTGACPGLPQAATRGAKSSDGITLGISPAQSLHEHRTVYSYPEESDVMLYTGMGKKGRNVILVRSADACIFIGGGMGTLNEFTIAFDDLDARCAIGILLETGGYSDEFGRLVQTVGRKPRATLFEHSDPATLVQSIFRHIDSADDIY
jgi:uncharacterized protein (TIGR00725 family)